MTAVEPSVPALPDGLRKQFPLLAGHSYLNTASFGALPTRAEGALGEYLRLCNTRGGHAWFGDDGWFARIERLRGQFARVIGGEAGEVAIFANVSTALSVISTAIGDAEHRVAVVAATDFPTLAYQWYAKQADGNALRLVPPTDGVVGTEAIERAIADDTAVVATSRVSHENGFVPDLERLAEVAHGHGALLLVDDYQATGQLPLDVRAAGVDILVSGSTKWLLGGPGVAFLWVRRDLVEQLRPTVAGWFGNEHQLALDPSRFAFRSTAARYEMGMPPMAAIATASAGLDVLEEVGLEAVQTRTHHLASRLRRQCASRGWTLIGSPDPARQSAIVTVAVEDSSPVAESLEKDGFVVGSRRGGIRIAPYFYNTDAEIDGVVKALESRVQLGKRSTGAQAMR